MATKDLTLHVSSKLGGEWSAPGVAGLLTGPSLEYLVSKWGSLDTMVKTRLLMAPLLLPPSTIESLNPALADMIEVARADKCARETRVHVLGCCALWSHTHMDPKSTYCPALLQGRVGARDGQSGLALHRSTAHTIRGV